MKTKIIYPLLILTLPFHNLFAAENFGQFKQSLQNETSLDQEFKSFKKSLAEEFKAYQAAFTKARQAEKESVVKNWGEYKPGSKTRWVKYEDNYRQSVNYESGEVELQLLLDKSQDTKSAIETLKKKIPTLLDTNVEQAFKDDKVLQSVEENLAESSLALRGNQSKKPILRSLIPELDNGDKKTTRNLSQTFAQNAKVTLEPAKNSNKQVVTLQFAIPVDAPGKSKPYMALANKVAEKEQIPLPLVMAVMEAESAFNPLATSPIPAYGLMQIVPVSAGQDASEYLYGQPKILSPSYLYNSDNNIKIGGAYLHILYHRYLKHIENPVSRIYCTIAAYNTGAGNVARAFTGTKNIKKASKIINTLTPREVYRELRLKLPYKETRDYLKKVSLNMQKYQST